MKPSVHLPLTPVPQDAKALDKIVGNNVIALRESYNASQKEIGKLLGVSFQQMQKCEHGTNRIGASRLYQLSCVFNVPISTFYKGLVEAEPFIPNSRITQLLDIIAHAEQYENGDYILDAIDSLLTNIHRFIRSGS